MDRCPLYKSLADFLVAAVGIEVEQADKYEIVWLRTSSKYGKEEVVLDNADAWEYFTEIAAEKKEVRISILKKSE
jgi:hypothetical protein